LAVDAERASGYRYSHRAYLIQLRRAGAGTFLIDPVTFDSLAGLSNELRDTEWVLHAASQDLPCLREAGMNPKTLFDTELGARLAGFERVGLAALTERLLGYALEKHHSAADWSTRPLPASWLTYAALDVELLVELRYALATELERQGKLGWAQEEFSHLLTAPPPKPRTDPWRRTSGIHKARGLRALARVRALWQARDDIARRRDVAPGRILPDAAIMAAAQADPPDGQALTALPGFGGRATRKLAQVWLRALNDARTLPDSQLPAATVPSDGPPPPHRWAERDPVAAGRLTRCRASISHLSEELAIPPENLLLPDSVRRLAWTPPEALSTTSTADALAGYGARSWQIELTAEPLATALADPPPTS
ncbi:MAG: HRDC domain-containing protein, partial [Micromonosporaceae bacterium]